MTIIETKNGPVVLNEGHCMMIDYRKDINKVIAWEPGQDRPFEIVDVECVRTDSDYKDVWHGPELSGCYDEIRRKNEIIVQLEGKSEAFKRQRDFLLGMVKNINDGAVQAKGKAREFLKNCSGYVAEGLKIYDDMVKKSTNP